MTRRFLISGHVQGVGFRWFVARHARQLGLYGLARNLHDGRVEVIVQGPAERLEQLEQVLRTGPAHAQVMGVERSEISDEAGTFKFFDIQ